MPPTPSTTRLSAQEAKERLREIVEGFFFRRLTSEDGKPTRHLLVKTPPGLGKTKEAALRAERAGARSVEERVPSRTQLNRTPVGRCATPRLRARPPPDPGHRGVTFVNGRDGDICIWWTQSAKMR
jgi:hypothetical protein